MNDKLIVKGTKNIEGMKFHDIEGGFGEDKKAMLVKEIAAIHGKEVGRINEAINRNRKRFTDDVDIIDLKGTKFAIDLCESEIYTRNSINASSNIYLLSERGYSKLLKILEDDLAWEQYEKLVDGYFNMRAEIKEEPKQLSAIEQLRLLYQVSETHEERFTKIEGQLESLEVSPSQRKAIQNARHKKIYEVLGGKQSEAYKDRSFRSKVYSDLGKTFNNYFDVPAYDCTPKNRFKEALEVIESYNMSVELTMEFKKITSQVNLNKEAI